MTLYITEINDQYITDIGNNLAIDFYNLISDKHLRLDNINASVTGVDSPYLNIAIDNTNNSQILGGKTVHKVIDFFKNNHVPWIWIVPSYIPNSYLLTHGFSVDGNFPCMYYNLQDEIPPIKNNQMVIQELYRNNDLSEWFIPIIESFSDPELIHSKQDNLYQKINARLLNNGQLCQFIAYYDNLLAGSATLFLSNDSVALHNIGVRPYLRKKGIGSALTLYMMHFAKKLGFKHCFLDSSDDGYRIYKQIGFKNYIIKTGYTYRGRSRKNSLTEI